MAPAELLHQPTPDALRRSESTLPRREVFGITIDGDGAFELDDAIWVEREGRDSIIHVSIADVVSAIDQDSEADRLARERGFTRYYSAGSAPMIDGAEDLSLTDTNPRPTITVSVPVSPNGFGEITVERTVLNHRGRLTYAQADRLMRRKGEVPGKLKDAYILAKTLRDLRLSAGALELETALPVDRRGQFITTGPIRTHASELVIQEFMLLANSRLAQLLSFAQLPAIYRNQLAPGGMSHEKARDEIKRLISDPKTLNEEDIARLRKMVKPAFFHSRDLGHFSLKGPYVQLTSPIRRYSDIINWRIVLAMVDGKPMPYTQAQLEEIAVHLNRAQQEAREQMINFQKVAARKVARSHIALGDFEGLSPKEFGRIIKIAAIDGMFTSGLEAAVYEAMERGTLSDADYCFLLFVAGETGDIPRRIRQKIMQKVRVSEKMARNLLRVGLDTFSNWTDLRFLSSYDRERKDTMVIASAEVTVGANVVSSSTILGPVNRDPLRHAATELVEKLSDPYPSHPKPEY